MPESRAEQVALGERHAGDEGATVLAAGIPIAMLTLGSNMNLSGGQNDGRFDSQGLHRAYWINEGMRPAKNEEVRAGARDAMELIKSMAKRELLPEFAKDGVQGDSAQRWILRQRVIARMHIAKLMQQGEMQQMTDADVVGRLLTWVAYLIEAAPHLTRDVMWHDHWGSVMEHVEKGRGKRWKMAKIALDRITTLVKAYAAGARADEVHDRFKCAPGETDVEVEVDELTSAYYLSEVTKLGNKVDGKVWSNKVWWEHLVKEGWTMESCSERAKEAETQFKAVFEGDNWKGDPTAMRSKRNLFKEWLVRCTPVATRRNAATLQAEEDIAARWLEEGYELGDIGMEGGCKRGSESH